MRISVAWGLIQQRYKNVKLIGMQHVGQLFQTPQTKKGDATSLRQLINFLVSNINAVAALSLNTSLQTLMLNHILLAALDADTHRGWELHVSLQDDMPSTAQVIAFLEQRCKALELLQTRQQTTIPAATSKHSTPVATSKHTSSSGNKVSQTARTYVTISVFTMQGLTFTELL
jgi:hypothetical protein